MERRGHARVQAYLICVPVGRDQELCGCFGDGIRIGRPQWTALVKDLRSEKSLTVTLRPRSSSLPSKSPPGHLIRAGPVHLIRADVDEAPRLTWGPVGSFQQYSGSIHIDVLEAGRGPERRLWSWQRRKMTSVRRTDSSQTWSGSSCHSPTCVLAARWKMASMRSVTKMWFTSRELHTSPCGRGTFKKPAHILRFCKAFQLSLWWRCSCLCLQHSPDSWGCSSSPTGRDHTTTGANLAIHPAHDGLECVRPLLHRLIFLIFMLESKKGGWEKPNLFNRST